MRAALPIALVACAALAAPAAAAGPPPGCAGVTVQDPAGDGFPFGNRVPAPSDPAMDITGVYFRSQDGRVSAHLRLEELPAAGDEDGAFWELSFHRGPASHRLRAIVEEGTLRFARQDGANDEELPLEGRYEPGKPGVISFAVPANIAPHGAKLERTQGTSHRARVHGSASATGGTPFEPFAYANYDTAYDDATGSPPPAYVVSACSDDPARPAADAKGEVPLPRPPATAPPAPSSAASTADAFPRTAPPASLRVLRPRRVPVRAVRRSGGLPVRLAANEPVRDVVVTVRRRDGGPTVAAGSIADLGKAGRVRLRLVRPLRTGRYVVTAEAVTAAGAVLRASASLTLTR
jgi:hypothetical protein